MIEYLRQGFVPFVAGCVLSALLILGIRTKKKEVIIQESHVQEKIAYERGKEDALKNIVTDRVKTIVVEGKKKTTTIKEHINQTEEKHESKELVSADISTSTTATVTRTETIPKRYLILGVSKGTSTMLHLGAGLFIFPQVSLYGNVAASNEHVSQWAHGNVSNWPTLQVGITYHF